MIAYIDLFVHHNREISKRFEQESKLYAAIGEIQRHKIFSHHAQQEVKRVEAIVEVTISCCHLIEILLCCVCRER